MAMLFEDYLKVRNAKYKDVVTLSDGRQVTITNTTLDHKKVCTKNMGLSYYDKKGYKKNGR